MIHLRLIVPTELTELAVAQLASTPGVVHLVRGSGTAVNPSGHVVLCDVVREAANDVIERLQDLGVHHDGAIMIETVSVTISDAAATAEIASPGKGGDALVWEHIEAVSREESALTVSFLVFMSIAAIIAAIGVLLDSPVLVIGAMVVGPDYGPVAAACVSIVRRRWHAAAIAMRTLVLGAAVAAGAAFMATVAFRLVGIAPDEYNIADRELTAFIAHPDAMAAVVAVLAGVVGMLSLTQNRSGALVGVLVSVTTIPAIGNIGAAAAYGSWNDVAGAAIQLSINVVALVLAGVVTLVVQSRATTTASSFDRNTPSTD